MAVTSSGDGNFSSVIAGGLSVNDDVIINHDVTLDGDAPNVNSLVINSGKTITGGGNTITIDSENASGFAVDIDGAISGNLDLEINTPAATNIDLKATSGNVRNVTINHASCAAAIAGGFMTITGNLTITAGSLNTGGNDLTVAGDVSVTGTLTGNASAISFGSLTIASGGTYSATSGTTTLTKDDTSQFLYETISGATFTNNDGTVLITGDGKLKPRAGTGNFHNLEINASGNTIDQSIALTCEGNLTITAGTLDTDSSNNYALTVTGRTDIGPASGSADQATLTCNASTVSLGSGRTSSYGLIVNQGGTFAGGSGTHTIGSIETKNNSNAKCTLTSGVTTIDSENTSDNFALSIEAASTFDDGNGTVTFTIGDTTRIRTNTKPLYNVIVNNANASIEYVGDQTIDNDLTVTAGKFRYNSFEDLTVTGDVSVTGILGHPNVATTSNSTFGSLTINSGGEYKAPSGTTTITDETSGGYGLINSGTFTHNNGKLKIDFNTPNKDAHTIIQVNELYDLEIDMNSSFYEVKFDDTSGNATNILNNLDITQGVFESKDNSDTLTIHGLTRITSNGTFMPDANHDTNKIIHNGLVTNSGTYKINDGTTVKMNAGIRNLGTITVA